ncbi:MAG TPA: cysteine desulfurase family protein [Acidimicrobiales bacterium]|nr:cysteine desulfurase family protein [Acidimicrobiales bacterium]
MATYLDHAATSPLRPEVFEAMVPFLTEHFGNPSGSHAVARRAKQAIEESRDVVAAALGVEPRQVIFTAGGTEADNLAIAGTLALRPGRAVCGAFEHHAVLHATRAAGGTVVGVTPDGLIDLAALAAVLDDRTTIVSVMLVNNEIGTIQPLDAVIAAVRERAPQARVLTDAVQALPWLDLTTAAADADFVAVSAHKVGGPKGVGALAARADLAPIIHGGGQEADRRSGTHNVAGIVGMATALRVTTEERVTTNTRIGALRDRLIDGLVAAIPGSSEAAPRALRVPGNGHLLLGEGVESESVLVLLDEAGVCASAGSACASGAIEPSHVLVAMGVPTALALSSVRLTLGPTTTDHDIDIALKAMPGVVTRLRSN